MTSQERVERKAHHLEMIQGVITRMAQNSFMLKGWALTLAAAVFTLAAAEKGSPYMVAVAMLPTLFFWYLDGFFVYQEKLFRKLYDDVADDIRDANRNQVALYDMKREKYEKVVGTVTKVMFSQTLKIFYPALLVAEIVAFAILIKPNIMIIVKSIVC